MDIFTFNPIQLEDILGYEKSSNVFNMSESDIEKERVLLASFDDEKLGSSIEKLDIAIKVGGQWELLDVEDKIKGYNEIPLGYVLKGVLYDEVMIILRRMSTMKLDRVSSGVTTYIYYKTCYADNLANNPSLLGRLASNKIRLDGSNESREMMKNIGILDDVCKLVDY